MFHCPCRGCSLSAWTVIWPPRTCNCWPRRWAWRSRVKFPCNFCYSFLLKSEIQIRILWTHSFFYSINCLPSMCLQWEVPETIFLVSLHKNCSPSFINDSETSREHSIKNRLYILLITRHNIKNTTLSAGPVSLPDYWRCGLLNKSVLWGTVLSFGSISGLYPPDVSSTPSL